MKKAPKTRFSPFQEEWASQRFADAFTVLPNNTLSRAELSDEAGTVKNVHYGDVLIKFGEYLDAGKTDIPFIASEGLAERWKSAALQDGDVVMADTAEDTTAGKCTEIGNVRSDTIVSGLHTIPLHPQSKFSEGFLGYYMNSDAFHDQLIPLMQGTKVTSISKTYLADTKLCFPPDSAEQAQIAQLLYSLDQMITSQQRKCEKLIALKAACLDKMFPKRGSKVPELRFAGFSGDWEPKKLGDVAISFDYGLNAAAKEFDGVNKYLRITDIDDSTRVFRDDDLTSPNTDLSSAGNYLLHEGEILFARTGASVGKTYIYKETDGLVFFAGFLIRAKIKSEYDAEFVFQNTLGEAYNRYIQVTSQRSGQPGVNAQEYAEYSFLLPTYSEQKRIGIFLQQIDNLIVLHQRKLGKLQQFKQAMMHNMFV